MTQMTSYKGISLGVNNSKVVEKKEKKGVSKGHKYICWFFFLFLLCPPPKEINGNTALTVQVQRLTCKCYCYYYVACKCH